MKDSLLNLRQLPKEILEITPQLIVNRIGNKHNAHMVTLDICGYICPQQTYKFENDQTNDSFPSKLIKINSSSELFKDLNKAQSDITPPHAKFEGRWIKGGLSPTSDANILGEMGDLEINHKGVIKIPVIKACPSSLAFYNAELISNANEVKFETNKLLPITQVSIGDNYVTSYLHEKDHGGGDYIEYHDQPHFWAPQSKNCDGHILLGIRKKDVFYLTGFKIPFGKGVYLSPYTLHSDAYLVGAHLVVYTVTEHYSTVIFKNKHSEIQPLEFYLAD
ncbi:MAG: hypothetical protein P1U74_11050 [Legionellaceae bacterium]|nr:hypothetical protein [Legionellaceae bacterium]